MKAAVLHTLGSVPSYEDFAAPVQAEGQTVVRVRAASLKNLDKGLASGSHYGSGRLPLPSVVGIDGVGVLEDGSRVYTRALPPYGMMAEQALVAQGQGFRLPDEVDDALGAALPNPALSAYFALEWRGQLKAGETVLVLGATGFTGTLAVQLAKQLGAGRVVAAGRNPARLEALTDLGADALITLAQDEAAVARDLTAAAEAYPFDLVIDYLWGRPTELLLAALGGHNLEAEPQRTRLVQVGSVAGGTVRLESSILRSAGVELYGMGGGSVPREQLGRIPGEVLPLLFGLAAAGKLHLELERVPLREVERTWQRNDLAGKRVVFIP